MDGDNKGVPHSDLEPGQAVSLRLGAQSAGGPLQPGTLPAPETFAQAAPRAQQQQAVSAASPSIPAITPAPQPQRPQATPAAAPNPAEDHFFARSADQSSAAAPALAPTGYGTTATDQYDQQYDEDQEEPVDAAWVSPEFVAHAKSQRWYLVYGGVSFVLILLAYLLTKDFITITAILICVGLFGYVAARPPRQQRFAVTQDGITIGNKTYPFKDFRSFAVEPENVVTTIDLMPLKRFAPMLNVTYMPEHDPYVPDVLAQHLPLSQHKRTTIDELMQLVRF